MDGIINIYKEKGYTSHDVVAIMRKTLNCSKVGHTGTLDPDAEGVLPICIGKGTKLADLITAETKRYTAEITLGIMTDTEDLTGKILEQREVNFDEEFIKETIEQFKGEYMQIPPMYSAIKIDGKKLYELARQGKTVERKARKIFIYDIEILEMLPPNKVKIDVICSKGTYIRTLCVDIGKKLGCGACMSALLRTQTGNFKLKDSIKLEQLKNIYSEGKIEEILIGLDDVLCEYPKVYTNEKVSKLLYNGNIIYEYGIKKNDLIFEEGKEVLVYDYMNKFIGIYKMLKAEDERWCIKPVKMLL